MSSFAIVAVVAIVVWGIVQLSKARHGIATDKDGNESFALRDDTAKISDVEETRREIEQLRERLHVLERIATDNNSLDARERARIAAEIEALRSPDEPAIVPAPTLSKEEQSQ